MGRLQMKIHEVATHTVRELFKLLAEARRTGIRSVPGWARSTIPQTQRLLGPYILVQVRLRI